MTSRQTLAKSLENLGRDQRGAGTVEYLLLVGLIALAALAGFRTFGNNVNGKAIELGGRVQSEIP